MPKQRLTDRQIMSGVTLTDLLHFVITGDTSQNPAGSSYKGNVEQLFDAFSAYTCTNPLILDTVNSCTTGITINGDVVINGSATTINTEVIQSKDNNIVLNYSGTHLTAIGGGITLEDGVSDGVDSRIFTNSDGVWLFDPGLSASTGTIDTLSACTGIYTSNIYGCSPITVQDDLILVSGLTATTVNVQNVLSGTPILNLGVDVDGNVVSGLTSGDNIYNIDGTLTTGRTVNVSGFSLTISGESDNVLTIVGSGDTEPLFTVQGSDGELFSITDNLYGELFTVSNVSALPILRVFDDDRILMGSVLAPSLNTTVITNPGTGLSTVYSLPMSAYTGAFFDYTVTNTGGARAGNIMSIFSGNTVEFEDAPTNDIGSTSGITFTMSADSTNALLQVSATTTGWEVKTIVRSI
jgi:hypothetical protein